MNTIKNPCWHCAKSGYGRTSECPWEREFKPVPGWIARETTHKNGKSSGGYTSYEIKYCPLFVPDRKTQPKQPAPEAFANAKRVAVKELDGLRGRERETARRAVYKKFHICLKCAAAFSTGGHTMCTPCRVKHAAQNRKDRREKA